MKKGLSLLLAILLLLSLASCARKDDPPTGAGTDQAAPSEAPSEAAETGDLVILYTNDVHCAYRREDSQGQLGYAALAAYKKQLEDEGDTVVLVDAGDAIQGDAIGTLSAGSYLVDMMNETGYSFAVPGNHEFDYGMETFLDLAQTQAEYEYLACNFLDLRTQEPVFSPYKIMTYGEKEVAFLGICTPETLSKSSPVSFQDGSGNYIYGFAEDSSGQALYDCVQKAIDDAKREGADYVVAIGHLGIDPGSTPWTSMEVIAHTTGISLFLDGHSHSVLEQEVVEDMDGNAVLLSSTGTKMTYVGQARLNLTTGAVETTLISGLTKDDSALLSYTASIGEQFDELLSQVVAVSEVDLVTQDPANSEQRIIRSQETNLGDFCADAYRTLMEADVGLVNGGGIRSEISAGDVTYGDILAVHPYGNSVCLVEATGQQILDALELAYRGVGKEEIGGFLQVSGLTCEVDTAIPSTVELDDKGSFQGVSGERRVKNVRIGEQPLEPEKTYLVASHSFLLKSGGDGFTMFQDAPVLREGELLDNQVLITYLRETLRGTIPASLYGEALGQGRITIF